MKTLPCCLGLAVIGCRITPAWVSFLFFLLRLLLLFKLISRCEAARSFLTHLELTHNPEGIVFDLLGEAVVLINPPLGAFIAGVVWEHRLSRPHLGDKHSVGN